MEDTDILLDSVMLGVEDALGVAEVDADLSCVPVEVRLGVQD